ncbi:conserved membrane family protein [Mycobacterium xenopi 4042]|uniref:Conserved membrane family protein n=1 Tax=Mycobacterium xenopi 4042 TaxID=1299334 RepID=X8APC0_MYCXE|nr:conserved membrane family protein [Mycobacterium xenopi 4042]
MSYLNEIAQPEQADFTNLPWTYTITTTIPAVIANVVAQGTSDTIGCRITVNGEVKDEQSSAGHHAQTSCLVKAA